MTHALLVDIVFLLKACFRTLPLSMQKENYALSPEELAQKYDSSAARPARYKGAFSSVRNILSRTFVKRPRVQRMEEINAEYVKDVACVLEAALVMAEETPFSVELAFTIKHEHLAHFVGYMRALDESYREVAQRNLSLVERVESLSERKYGSQAVQTFAPDRAASHNPHAPAEVRHQGALVRGEPSDYQRSPEHPWNIPMAQKSGIDFAEDDLPGPRSPPRPPGNFRGGHGGDR